MQLTKRLKMGMLLNLAWLALPAHATYTVYLYESAGNVVATGSGSINTAGLTAGSAGGAGSLMVKPRAIFAA